MQNSTVMFTIFVFERKHPFWANLVQKFKMFSLDWNLAPGLIQICRIQWWCSLLPFSTRNNLLRQIWSKKSTLSLTWNFVLRLIQICRIQWWCSLFCLWLEIPFLVKCGPKNQNFQFKLKFGAKNSLNMQNSMMVFTFSVFYR